MSVATTRFWPAAHLPTLTRALVAVTTFYVVLLGALYLGQRRLLFPRGPAEPLGAVGTLEVAFPGGTVPVVWVPRADAPVVLWFHGNGEQLADTLPLVRHTGERGLSFAGMEYPGYGLATGVGPSEASLLDAARATLDALAARGVDTLTCVGQSMGTGVAAAMAAEGRCARLVLLSPYTSLADAAQHRVPFVPARWLVHDTFDTRARAPAITVPTLVMHGRRDLVVPVEMGRTIAERIPGARYVERDRGHNDLLDTELFGRLARFARGEPDG